MELTRGSRTTGRTLAAPMWAAAIALLGALALALACCAARARGETVSLGGGAGGTPAAGAPGARPGAPRAAGLPAPAVGLRVLRLLDHSRVLSLPGRRSTARTLLTYVRYPALAAPGRLDLVDAPPAVGAGPYPLIVFAHGFAVTPSIYARVLQSWARAGYVVAAPVFPGESAGAPGGPDESDLINEPADMSFVISRLLRASGERAGPLTGLIDPSRIAVSGQSDGGVAALAAAYSRKFRDRRVGATVVMSGAELSGVGGYRFAAGGPPLLAIQGTADTVNEPRFTYAFFRSAHEPKYLLRLLGARHLAPYTTQQPQLGIVERTTRAFLDAWLKRAPGASAQLASSGNVAGKASLLAVTQLHG